MDLILAIIEHVRPEELYVDCEADKQVKNCTGIGIKGLAIFQCYHTEAQERD